MGVDQVAINRQDWHPSDYTVEPRFNQELGTMKPECIDR